MNERKRSAHDSSPTTKTSQHKLRSVSANKESGLVAIKYLPYAVFQLLRCMPHPWENTKFVDVIVHKSKALTIVDNSKYEKIDLQSYISLWSQTWNAMRDEKRDRVNFRRVKIPCFDDEEEITNYKSVSDLVPVAPLAVPVTQRVNGFQKLVDSEPFILRTSGPPMGFSTQCLLNSKAINCPIPNGPEFNQSVQPLAPAYDVLSTLDDPRRCILRSRQFPVRVECRVIHADLYTLGSPNVCSPEYIEPVDVHVTRHDNKLPFFVDSSISVESAGDTSTHRNYEGTPGDTSVGCQGFLSDCDLPNDLIAQNLACYNAPYPFNQPPIKNKHKEDVAFMKPFYKLRRPFRFMPSKTRRSYQRLLKTDLKRHLHLNQLKRTKRKRNSGHSNTSVDLPSLLKSTKYFESQNIDWLEAALQLCAQAHTALKLMIHKRGLHFMHLDYNFNVKAVRALSTKERKRSRFGLAFNIIRELLRLVKMLTDLHVQFRMKEINAYELADGINFVFNHMGQLSGIYRYKYKTMHQIIECQDLKHVVYDRFNSGGVGKGPGCGFWHPSWRVWLFYLRGVTPLLERWLGNLVTRQLAGRVDKGVTKTVTKQRMDSHYDLELRAAVLQDILDSMPEKLRKSKTVVIMQHLSEAWRCWKAAIEWDPEGVPFEVKQLINKYVELRSQNYKRQAKFTRQKIIRRQTMDKSIIKRNSAKYTRLYMQNEQRKQEEYAIRGPSLMPEHAVRIYKCMAEFYKASSRAGNHTGKISFPSSDYPQDTALLTLALENIRDQFGAPDRLSNQQKGELEIVESAFANPQEMLVKIKKQLLSQRVFNDIDVELHDYHTKMTPVYHLNIHERIQDAYLDQYLWFESVDQKLFPSWVKTGDSQLAPVMAYQYCAEVNNVSGIWDLKDNRRTSLLHLDVSSFIESADMTLVNHILKLVVDSSLADYMTAKMNAVLNYKDMSHVHRVGILRGLQFSSFVIQMYLVVVDVLLLGLPRSLDLAKGLGMKFHPIRHYMRFDSHVYIVFNLSSEESMEVVQSMEVDNVEVHNVVDNVVDTRNVSWPIDFQMRESKMDKQLGLALVTEMKSRVTPLGTFSCLDASVYSRDNAALYFEFLGFELRLSPARHCASDVTYNAISYDSHSTHSTHITDGSTHSWPLIDRLTGKCTAVVHKMVSSTSIKDFDTRILQIALSAGTSSFQITAKRWNSAVLAVVAYFRDAIQDTPQFLKVMERCEQRIQNVIKRNLNTKMPERFPPCVFYSPEELGGLGMLSVSKVEVPKEDIAPHSSYNAIGGTDDNSGWIPQVFQYIPSWIHEMNDSKLAWQEFKTLQKEAQENESRVMFEDVEHLLKRGLPRINTMFQKDKNLLLIDRGFRLRTIYRRFYTNPNPYWFVNFRHDGFLWDLTQYKDDCVRSLGGVSSILDHTLFKATGFTDWEGLLWQRQSTHEQFLATQKLTNAQRQGLSQIPNRRFTLWWSPTINRANIFVGFLVQLDLTGIFLHGKIPTLKISYVQLFRAHLWQKIHESLVLDVCRVIDREQSVLNIQSVRKLPVHPRKSYKMHASAADISLDLGSVFPLSGPAGLDDKVAFGGNGGGGAGSFWIDVQLRYGDFDAHDTKKYTKAKFLDYTNDGTSLYPNKHGLIICVDLAYNTFYAYGYWFPGLHQFMKAALPLIVQSNPGLYVFRERVRKALQLYATEPRKHLAAKDFPLLTSKKTLIIDDKFVYRFESHATINNRTAHKTLNGAVLAFDPRTGKLHVFCIDVSKEWAGQKRLSAVSKWTTAEQLALFFRSLDTNELPEQVVISSHGLKDPMEVNMLEFPSVNVEISEMQIPLVAVNHVTNVILQNLDQLKQNKRFSIDLYDDWLVHNQPSTCLSRLSLLLRAFSLNKDRTDEVLRRYAASQDAHVGTATQNLWPSVQNEEWVEIEEALSTLVVSEFALQNEISPSMLNANEIKEIILGNYKQVKSASGIDPTQPEIDFENSNNDNMISRTIQTHNVHGDQLTVVTTSNYEQQTFDSTSKWRQRALKCIQLGHMADQVTNLPLVVNASKSYDLPKHLITEFLKVVDCDNICLGVLTGRSTKVEGISIVPQIGTPTNVSYNLPTQNNGCVGYIRTSASSEITPLDLLISSKIGGAILLLNLSKLTLKMYEPTTAGIEWIEQNKDLVNANSIHDDYSKFAVPLGLELTMKQGYFEVPEDDIWNFSFLPTLWNTKVPVYMKFGLPLDYYHGRHRPRHFQSFQQLEDYSE